MARSRKYTASLHPRLPNGQWAPKGKGSVRKSRGLSYASRKQGAINRGLTTADKSRGKHSLKAKINRSPSGRNKWKIAAAVTVGVGATAAGVAAVHYANTTAKGDLRRAANYKAPSKPNISRIVSKNVAQGKKDFVNAQRKAKLHAEIRTLIGSK